MRKQITIIQGNSSPLVIDDSDPKDITEYTNDLAKLLENQNVTLLHTTSCSVIIRPHIINSIVVKELDKKPTEDQESTEEETKPNEDIVTDTDDAGIVSD